MSTKVGSIGHNLGLFHCHTLGWEPLIPIIESAAYDYAVWIPEIEKTVKVQAKTSTRIKNGSHVVNLRSKGPTAQARRFDPDKVDFLSVSCVNENKDEVSLYLMPSHEVTAQVTLHVDKEKHEKYLMGVWIPKNPIDIAMLRKYG